MCLPTAARMTGPWIQGKVGPGTPVEDQALRAVQPASRMLPEERPWMTQDGGHTLARHHQGDRKTDGLCSPLRWIAEPGGHRRVYSSHPSLPVLYVNFQRQDVLGQLSGAGARGGA